MEINVHLFVLSYFLNNVYSYCHHRLQYNMKIEHMATNGQCIVKAFHRFIAVPRA